MEIAEFIKAKDQLESDLAVLLKGRLDRFKQETGFTPSGINVYTASYRMLNRAAPTLVIERVTVDVPLEVES